MQTDLFGAEIAKPSVTEGKPRKMKPATKLVFDRKALWSTSGYLPGAKEVDEDDVAKATATSDTRSDNATIERLEAALGLAPLVKNGQWMFDAMGFLYRRVGKPFTGTRQFGGKGQLVRELNHQLTLRTAREAIEPLFTDPCSWLVINSVSVLNKRLWMMAPEEDHKACLAAFLEVMSQHDFIDNSRSGETIRSLTKRDQMREKRAAKRKDLEQKKVQRDEQAVEALMDAFEQDDCDFIDDITE